MGMKNVRSLLVLCLAGLILGGCASSEPADSGPDLEPIEQAPDTSSTETSEAAVGPVVENGKIVLPTGDGMGTTEMLNGVFYFDFDQAIVKRAGHEELDKHAEVLASDRYLRVRLEGHADERGTREYNLALGERRANALRAYLVAQGASRSQIEVISYGEEKPANSGHSESAWAQNRRVEIVYR
ncbi:MAG: peptidoglycan-associated lipoprotein Pal [Pseudomonadales bacterium]|nr:peptidoglycan-associated lipoprotein Pal [Pseudomonadales bacterium]MBO6563575.1 peptidoglycan-associated lipoprotein Pal [Pseudomonadales bacterium]MBO6594364.1 peptidoglycan-associated lipoprotein Pal [Pseudomonadales bacterium]MBO6655540.1 peptidoglycan-associated lipoprotein Pal [Pseudomonadales bacterium]MBO6700865.1 peptidoglycan-associated lipoprotein Pal [Pseudomonadales bacterium]